MKTVTNDNWCVSSTSGTYIKGVILSVFKVISQNPWKIRRGDADGRVFASTEEANEFCLKRGYTKTWSRIDYFSNVNKSIVDLYMSRGRKFGETRKNKHIA